MASRYIKASDNNNVSRVIVSSKKKRASQILRACYKAPSVGPTLASLSNKSQKRKRDNNNNKNNNCKSSTCLSSSSNILLKNYSNFMKSGIPQRVLFSEDNQWNDFPQAVIDLVKEKFIAKTTSIEVKFNGEHLMLDVIRMNKLDLKTGVRKPIAWIDEKGSCFFPENNNFASCHESKEFDPEIKLHVEIELNDGNNFEDCVEESNVKRVKIDDQCVEKIEIDEESVKSMFMKGVSENSKVDIMEVKKCSGGVMESKLHLFNTQVEITKKLRGNANVEYGWFTSPKGAPFTSVGHDGLKLGRYGYGVHLHSAQNSDIISDVDEKGVEVKCMVLCRVILGNMEVVLPGSKQFYASNECYDSGVDDVENPNHFVVWNMNMNTHIYPEYAVSFKIFPNLQGNPNIERSSVDLSTKGPHDGPLQIDSSPSNKLGQNEMQFHSGKESVSLEKVPSVGSSTSRAPNSPWMPFSKLFEEISHQVAPHDMNRIHILYQSLRGNKTSREEFIKKLRSIVGDKILRATIYNLQSKA